MYIYTDFDRNFLRARVAEFRDQVERRIDGSLTEDEFKPLRLMNGLYLQLHAYMLRVAIPYGSLRSAQMRKLAEIADRWDKGYGHFTTRQNIQFNWPKLSDVPDMLDALADVNMHAIQTSGNCIRNVTADHFAGATPDEVEDPRITAELIRQWSTDHPEFAYLPRKFKLAVTGTEEDRAVIRFHDIGIRVREQDGEVGYQIVIGGGLGRTPMIGKVVREFLPRADLFAYLEAILKVYNLSGRRDNKYKARIKILVHETGLEELKSRIETEFATQKRLLPDLNPEVVANVRASFVTPAFKDTDFDPNKAQSPALRAFLDTNARDHARADHASVTVSIKPIGGTPGDATSDQMRALADIAEAYGYDELRISHEQNVILPHVHRADLPAVYDALRAAGLATANVGLISDIIACPGMDYCALATARSIPIAQQIGEAFSDLDAQHDIGPLKIKISGCINACGHHHVGHIGILGLDRAGVENYQITLGGDGTEEAAVGTRTGPGFAYDEIVPAVERLIEAYLDQRLSPEETFLAAYRRLGLAPFKDALYGDAHAKAA
ncbi:MULTISPECIES: nitrite/sulfite reductase [Shimia]|uniref:nitrite/sulfite reductase n=1 Tax=Shimia TaxID=573139 RepID=UPI001FB3707D|nr:MULTISPECIES: nitrite/sulfite reductase [Shimia]MDV4144919.1 nitrite/sulfite reductase [Shimia sp. FJ5]